MTMKTWFRWPVVLSAALLAVCLLAAGSLSSAFVISARAQANDPPMLPLPASVPPRTSIELACEPAIDNVPASTVLVPCQVSAPVR